MKSLFLCILTAALSTLATAQTSSTGAFPSDAVAASASEIQQRFAGKTFDVKLADGGSWHVEYKGDGSFRLKMNNGFSDTGDWKTEDGKICSKGRKIGSSCNEIRTQGDTIFLKRDSGEIVQFVAE